MDQMVVSFEKNSLAYGLMEEIVIKPAKVQYPLDSGTGYLAEKSKLNSNILIC